MIEDKESKEAFRKKAIPAFVDLLQMAKEAIILYRKRESEGEEPAFDEIAFQEVLMTANCLVSVGFASAAPDLAAVEEVARRTVAEGPMPVRVENPAAVHDAFTQELERQKIDVPAARRVCAALVATPPGREMLRVMLYDAVMQKRKAEARGGGQPPAPPRAEG
jgi:hypothetical protein